ncbi:MULTISPECIES: anthranilate phosphoribosyltransferase [Olivibacter]|jgi:anthranilate phosphoribosyltransferase|uniref:Anthranilate phosphoribosyltransferase n=2 Tax=Olivibacter TaxID=376469 RepID=A0ABV6HLB7_9SPHI|nr:MULTISPECIES: anthranilate phosphoribosyltransferase [Olivibacter]MCL4641833.1 anthranilate phosphoribosyltransferase [Olivibacter sp. UJ_SKK_5.1]MDM8174961.1 anthranilate phosphoribosyltransferase [Olivibacter sp. 47]MDX3913358.1 anthranilate phosphoribosyltransferase [Pseudosphingobacterium sp.]QEL01741.1 anthranilate phosphoribosyltransferase [Olivibacter sp. LS-1]
MKRILTHLFESKTFTKEEAYEILTNITSGKYNSSQMAAFMTAYCMRNITVEELAGFRDAMLDLCLKIDFKDYKLIDLCGTGGDGKNTFNISTLASFVVAGAGYQVAKHGNYGVSSGCGSSNVMEFLGYRFTNEPGEIYRSLDEAGICFLHAPLFHPAMKTVAPIRKELGVKTFFNMLGPLVNPAEPIYQSVGVFSLELARLYGYLYQKTNKRYSILHAFDGYDEISLTGDFKVIGNKGEQYVSLESIGFDKVRANEINGGETIEEAARIFMDVLNGTASFAQKNVVLCNAAIAIQTICPSKSFADCYYEAEASLLSKKALLSFNRLVKKEKAIY